MPKSKNLSSPVSKSTPKNLRIKGRGGIHDHNTPEVDSFSPIPKSSGDRLLDGNPDYDSASDHDSADGDHRSVRDKRPRSNSVSQSTLSGSTCSLNTLSAMGGDGSTAGSIVSVSKVLGCLFVLLAVVLGSKLISSCEKLHANTYKDTSLTLADLKHNFSSQEESTWTALKVGLKEVIRYNRPFKFLMLYDDRSKNIAGNLIHKMAKFVSCKLNNNCSADIVSLNGYDIYQEMGVSDYGIFLDKYKPELERKKIMVVYDLHRLSGQLSLSFHSMCDEYMPLVHKAVYFFTVKVNNVSDTSELVEQTAQNVLRESWSDIKDDKFYPLFTRISTMVLKVMPEN